MNKFNLFIIDALNSCNLRCDYCYARSNIEKYPAERKINRSTLVKIFQNIKELYDKGLVERLNFVWPGGEPLLLGIDFFRNAFALQKDIFGNDVDVFNQINTNATLINEEWINFFEKNNINPIVGIDGPDNSANQYRKLRNGENAAKLILKGVDLIKKSNLDLKILSVITNENYQDYKKLYKFLKDYNVKTADFLPCYDCNQITPVTNENYFHFMSNLYDLWTADKKNKTLQSITLLSSIKKALISGETSCCTLLKNCGHRLYFNFNGEIRYCCNGMFTEELFGFGNIEEFESLFSPSFQNKYNQVVKKIEKSQDECKKCPIFEVCGSGCSLQKKIINGNIKGRTEYCKARYWLIKYIYEDIKAASIFNFNNLSANPPI